MEKMCEIFWICLCVCSCLFVFASLFKKNEKKKTVCIGQNCKITQPSCYRKEWLGSISSKIWNKDLKMQYIIMHPIGRTVLKRRNDKRL